MKKPILLDTFCKAGGATKGYQRAGFYVIGVDIDPQPNYVGDEFIQGDALKILDEFNVGGYGEIKAIHASPPCQAYSTLGGQHGRHNYPDLVAPTRELLVASELPYIIENVVGAPLINPVMLCGTMFPDLRVRRHRLFESNFPLTASACGKHPPIFTYDKRSKNYQRLDQNTSFVSVVGHGYCSRENARKAMGITWMRQDEITQAIPPAYTEFLGKQLASYLSGC